MKSMLLAFLAVVALASAKVDYSGHMVLRVVPETQEQLDFLVKLQVEEGIDFWEGPAPLSKSSDFRVSPQTYYPIARRMAALNLSHKIILTDVGKMITEDEQERLLERAISGKAPFSYTNYHTLAEIQTYMREVDAANRGVTIQTIGRTGGPNPQDILMAVVTNDVGGSTKPVIYVECAMHAREWVTPPTCLWLIDELVSGRDPKAKSSLDFADWHIVPVSNPEGYAYTWTNDRMWRKNRAPNAGATCIGTDPNRNFDSCWGCPGASNQPCSDTFWGSAPFSAAEAAAMRDAVNAVKARAVAAVSIHAYSQYWMSPWGNTTALPSDYPEMYRVMNASVKALTAVHGTQYKYGSIANVIYVASGSTADWAYEKAGVLYSYALEMRDTGTYGFILPANQIIPTAEETAQGMWTMALEIEKARYEPAQRRAKLFGRH